MRDNVTIVTAFVDIGRGDWVGDKNGQPIAPYIKRDTATYMKRFERLTKLKNPIVCFTQRKFFDQIIAMRSDITLIDIDSVFDDHDHLLKTISTVQTDPKFISHVRSPSSPEYWSPQYVLINFLKSHFVAHAINKGFCTTSTTAWIDFGYARDEVYCPENKLWSYDTEDRINVYAIRDINDNRPIFDIVFSGDVYIQGCHIVAPNDKWPVLSQLVNSSLASILNSGLIDDDQTILLMAYRAAANLFKINTGNPENWFIIFEGNCND